MCDAMEAMMTKKRIEVVAYADEAVGKMETVGGIVKFTDVLLKPTVTVAEGTDLAVAAQLHEKAHHHCFIANSVNFPVRNEAKIMVAQGAKG